VRLSTSKPVRREDDAIDAQLDLLRQYVAGRNLQGARWEITATCVEGEKDGIRAGQRAKRLDRSALQKLLGLARARRIDVVLVTRLEQLSRSMKDLLTLVEQLNGLDVQLVSLRERLDFTAPSRKLMTTLIAALVQFGRDATSAAPQREEDDQSTRRQLLEAAGQVFAEKGFDRATGKEICERTGTNAAAVNYHFGGMEGLYAAVVREAHSRLVTFDALSAAVAGKADARAKLQAVISLFVRTLTSPASASWVLRVIGREMVAPSPALDVLREQELLPKLRILRAIVGEFMGLPEDHPAVAHGCVSVMAPCVMLLIGDRCTLMRAFPNFGLASKDAAAVVRHLVRFALAGLSAVARDVRVVERRGRSR
jgi:AcrR family transcriptional regulator